MTDPLGNAIGEISAERARIGAMAAQARRLADDLEAIERQLGQMQDVFTKHVMKRDGFVPTNDKPSE